MWAVLNWKQTQARQTELRLCDLCTLGHLSGGPYAVRKSWMLGWTFWVTYKCPEERACSLIGGSEIKLLTSCIFLSRLTKFLTCDYCPKLQFGRGYIIGTVTLYSTMTSQADSQLPLEHVLLWLTPCVNLFWWVAICHMDRLPDSASLTRVLLHNLIILFILF